MTPLLSWTITGVVAYLLGSIPTGVILSRVLSKPDVRCAGSTHTGGLNVMRVVGFRAAVLTVITDAAKGIVAVAFARWIGAGDMGLVLAATLAVVGHCWPIYTRFRGGMGLATGCGILFWLAPDVLVALFIVWAILHFGLLHHAARAVGAAVLSLPFIIVPLGKPPVLLFLGLAVGVVIFIRHIPDFQRVYHQEQRS